MNTVHNLKIWPEHFQDQKAGIKPFEIRKNDRNYKVGDILILEEWNPDWQQYTGEMIARTITLIVENVNGLEPGYCVLGTKP